MNERSKQLRIGVLTTSFPRFRGDEATLFLGRLIDAFSEAGHNGHLFVPFDREEERGEQWGGFHVHRVKYGIIFPGKLAFGNGILPNLRKNPLLVFQAPALLFQLFRNALRYQDEFDIIHAHWIATAIPAYFLSLLSKKPFLLTVRGEDIKLLRTPLKYFLSFFLNKASEISTVSDAFKVELEELLPNLKTKLSVTPNGVTRFESDEEEKKQLLNKYGISYDSKILLYVGRVVPLKQPEHLIELLHKLLPKHPELTLVLAGRVSEKYRTELIGIASKLAVGERLYIPGALTPTEVGLLMNSAKLYLSASTHEGRSNAILEALASGVPVAASQIPGHEELIKHSDNGILFDTDKLENAATELSALLSSDTHWQEMSIRAVSSVQHLTWKTSEKRYSECFSRILSD